MTKLIVVIITILSVLRGAQAYNASFSRVRRQAGQNCQSDPFKFQCRTTAACIDSEKMCDGIEDCRDGSDELDTVCQKIPCPAYLFRCRYGACVDADFKCNGQKNCRDNSDETDCPALINKVNTNCRSDEFECQNGQCIEMDARCNGIVECTDKSDETEELCLNTDCPEYTYKCRYGACVDGDSRCNGVKNCADNSDEANCASTVATTPPNPLTTPSNAYCSTPPHPENGRWTYLYNPDDAALPNVAAKPRTTIIFRCDPNYKLSTTAEEGQLVYCTDAGGWSLTVLPRCLRLCPKRVNKNHVTLECKLDDSKIACDKATPGTRMTYRCDSYFEPASAWSVNICGENGEWFYDEAKCQEICGEKRVSVEPLVIGGRNVIRGDYPWVVALYSNKDTRPDYTNICGGSLLSTSIVITAAHCVTVQDTGDLIHSKYFKVSAGKYYNRYGDSRDNDTAQYSSISKIVKHEWYKGQIQNFRYDIALLKLVTAFALSKVVQPVCLPPSDVNNPLLRTERIATVTGWGYTSSTGRPSDVLKVVELEYVDQSQCRTELDPSFASQYLVEDKICAGHVNKNTSVCQGDSGGGLVVQGPKNRYYLQGLVSLGQGAIQNNQRSCRSERRALFTNVNKYLEGPNYWIQEQMQRLIFV